MPLFCRHNRFEHNCPICSKERAAAARATRATPARAGAARRTGGATRTTRVVTRKLARAADDGYRHDLVPGIKATADAERLAVCLAVASERLEFPGPYPAVAEAAGESIEEATWLAFLLALAGPDRPQLQEGVLSARPTFDGNGESGLGPEADRTIGAYRAWVARAGSQEAAITGDNGWTPERRFARTFERLAIPGFHRAPRYDFLTSLGAAGVFELEADALHPGENDAATVAAKRALIAGDMMFLERRAKALAEGTGVPVAALDRGLVLWDSTADVEAQAGETLDGVRAALGLA